MSNDEAKKTVVRRLEEAGLDTDRVVDVEEGKKRSVNHAQVAAALVSGNYGIYATADDQLVWIDVDDYDDLDDKSGLSALARLPVTFEQGTPHSGTHRAYVVEPDEDGRMIAEVFEDHPDIGKKNPNPTWGEVRVANQYVVGAGSQLDDCEKGWCDDCAKPDGGWYTVQSDKPIATISADDLVDVLLADPNYAPEEDDTENSSLSDHSTPETPSRSTEAGSNVSDDADLKDILSYALTDSNDEKLKRLWRGDYSDYDGDRSEAESALAYKLAFWLQGDKGAVERAMNGTNLPDDVSPPRLAKWEERGSDGYQASVLEAVDAQSEHFEPSRRKNADPSEIDYSEVDRGDAILAATTGANEPAGDLMLKNGCYGYEHVERDEHGNVERRDFQTVTNFTLETRAKLNTYEGELLTIRVHPHNPREEPYDVQVHPTVFNETRSFKEEIVRGWTTQYSPGKYTQKALNDLRMTVGAQDAPNHEGTEFIGMHGNGFDEWVTPNGTLTADGWADDPEYVYYEKGGDMDSESSLAQKWELDAEDGADYDADAVRTILEKLPRTRRPDRGLPVLGWFYAAAFKPIIHARENEFPLLQVSGGTETGKTSTLEMFYEAFGAESSPFGCGDTRFTIEKKLSGSCGLPIWLDEYKPTDLGSKALDWLHRRLREVTREKTVAKGRPNLGEITMKFRAPVVFSGEQTVTEAAVRRRTVITTFSSGSTTGEYQRAFSELTGASYTGESGEEQFPVGEDLHEHALAYYRHILGYTPEEAIQMWKDAREETADILQELDIGGLDDSEFRGLQTVTFGVQMHRRFAEEMDVAEETIPERGDLKRALSHAAGNIGPDGQRREHIDEFTELLTQAASAGYLEEDVHYRVVDSAKWETTALAFHMPTTFSVVKKYVREFNLEDDYSIIGKNDYLDNFRDKAEEASGYPLDVNRKIRGLENGTKAVYIDTELAAEHLRDGFNLRAFTSTDEEDEESADIGLTTLANLDVGRPGTITATIGTVLEPPKWLAGKGILEDNTDYDMDYEVPEGRGTDSPLSGTSPGDTVRISGARIRTDDDGFRYVEITPTCEVEKVDVESPSSDDDSSGDATVSNGSDAEPEAAADGGSESPDADTVDEAAEGARADARRLAEWTDNEGEQKSRVWLIERATDRLDDCDPERAEKLIDIAVRQGWLMGTPESGYEGNV